MTLLLLAPIVLGGLSPVSIRVEGEGYLRFANDGRIVYARSASLVVKDGRLSDANGASVMPLILVDQKSDAIKVEADGTILVSATGKDQKVGRISLALFPAGEALAPQGAYLAAKTRPSLEFPGTGKAGKLTSSAGTQISETKSVPATTTGLSLVIEPVVEVAENHITLDKLAKSSGPVNLIEKLKQIDFGLTPKAGFNLKITRQRILAKLRYAGIAEDQVSLQCPEVIEVGSPGQKIDIPSLIEAARVGAIEKLGALEMKLDSEPSPFTVPIGALEYRVESANLRQNQVVVSVAILIDGRRINAKQIVFRAEAPAILVKAGDLIKVVVLTNGIAVEVTGRAKRSGRLNENIEVEVSLGEPPVKSVHVGAVKAAGMVEVRI